MRCLCNIHNYNIVEVHQSNTSISMCQREDWNYSILNRLPEMLHLLRFSSHLLHNRTWNIKLMYAAMLIFSFPLSLSIILLFFPCPSPFISRTFISYIIVFMSVSFPLYECNDEDTSIKTLPSEKWSYFKIYDCLTGYNPYKYTNISEYWYR